MREFSDKNSLCLQHVFVNALKKPLFTTDALPFKISGKISIAIGIGILQTNVNVVIKGLSLECVFCPKEQGRGQMPRIGWGF